MPSRTHAAEGGTSQCQRRCPGPGKTLAAGLGLKCWGLGRCQNISRRYDFSSIRGDAITADTG